MLIKPCHKTEERDAQLYHRSKGSREKANLPKFCPEMAIPGNTVVSSTIYEGVYSCLSASIGSRLAARAAG